MSNLFNEDEVDMDFYHRNSHPTAKEILQDSFYWKIADDLSPIGNDIAADALSVFWSWRDENGFAPTLWFTTEEFLRWGFSEEQLEQVVTGKWEDRIGSSKLHLAANCFDDLIISIAFGQFIKEGSLDKDLKEEALKSIDRQLNSEVLNYRCFGSFEAKDAYTKTKEALLIMPTKSYSLIDSFKFWRFLFTSFIKKRI